MSESPQMREVSGKFAELARIEAIVEHGKVSLLEQISDASNQLGKMFRGDQIREGVYAADQTIYFRARPILRLVFDSGYQPSPKKTLARCEIRLVSAGRGDESVAAVLHLVRVNDHGEWECVPMQALDEQTRFTAEHLLGLLDTYVSVELKRYTAGAS